MGGRAWSHALDVGLSSGLLYVSDGQWHRGPLSRWYEGSDTELLEKRPLCRALVLVFFCSNCPGPRP